MTDSSRDAVPPQDAVHVTHDARMGRRLTASRSFEAGERVLHEQPSLSWPHDQVAELVAGFLSAPPSVQMAVLDMAAPELDHDLDQIPDQAWRREATTARLERACERHELALSLAAEYDGERALELIEKLLRVGDANAQSFEGRVGLFPRAAMANHSCEPNCGWSTQQGGALLYYARHAIEAGEDITISYLGGVWGVSTRERRSTLLLQKCFFCRAARGLEP